MKVPVYLSAALLLTVLLARLREHRSSFAASSRVDLRYFGHLPGIRNRFSATSYPLESTFTLVP
jgi:hypothetical protein